MSARRPLRGDVHTPTVGIHTASPFAADGTFEAFCQRQRFGSLDGLRALSIVGVVWFHAARRAQLPFAAAGAQGVQLFFVISGFLIVTLLLRERERSGTIGLLNFYGRRSLRIFPMYYTVLAAYTLVVQLLESDPVAKADFFHNLPYFATYTSNWKLSEPQNGRIIFYFAWSLAAEEQFYLMWPSVERYVARWSVPLMILVLALRQAVVFELMPVADDGLFRTVLLSIQPTICLGVLLAHMLNTPRGFAVAQRVVGWRWSSAFLLIAVVVCAMYGGRVPWAMFVSMAMFVASCVVREDHALAPVLGTTALVSIGSVSYGIYLMHMLGLNAVERVAGHLHIESAALIFAVALVGVWSVAVLSFRQYESRFLRLKARF